MRKMLLVQRDERDNGEQLHGSLRLHLTSRIPVGQEELRILLPRKVDEKEIRILQFAG